MFKPEYKITIGGIIINTTDEPQASTIIDLIVAIDMGVTADSFTFVLGQVGNFKPTRDDEIVIELGYANNGNLTQIMTGTVADVEHGLKTTRAIGYSAAATLLRTYVDKTYESKTAGQIARDLADQASVDVATAEDGITFPAYVIDSRRSVFQHVHDLAELCGFDLYINADGGLVFEKFTRGKTTHTFEYAQQIIELEVQQVPPRAPGVEVWGESPGGSHAEEAWAWLTKDFRGSKGGAGSGSPILLLERPALRTADAARAAAEAAHARLQRQAIRGRMLVPGQPKVKLGDAIRLTEVPEEILNGTFQVRRVLHRITRRGGFTTTVDFRVVET